MSDSGSSIGDMMMMMFRFKESVDKSAKTRPNWIPELPSMVLDVYLFPKTFQKIFTIMMSRIGVIKSI